MAALTVMTKIQSLTNRVLDGEAIDDSMAADVAVAAEEMMSGEASPVQMAALLTALRAKGESPAVVAAFARVLRARVSPFKRPAGILLDTCGTGGDHSGTFNISTAAAFVAAGAGVRVAKHGNRSMTSQCGSADVLEALGVRVDCSSQLMERALEEVGICFLYAQCYHQSMKHVGPVRRELGFRTIFNILGPLANPAKASHQLLGAGTKSLALLLADVLARLEIDKAMVVHGKDGLDEISITTDTIVFEVQNGQIKQGFLDPEEFGIPLASRSDIQGGDAKENASILRSILEGEQGPRADIVALNAGAAIYIAGGASDLAQGLEKARETLSSGAALQKMQQLVSLTQDGAPQ